jgi:hypothetical protein
MDSYFMDQVMDSFLEDECNLPSFTNDLSRFTPSEPDPEPKEEHVCQRCGGPLYWNSCDCYYQPNEYGHGGYWTTGD